MYLIVLLLAISFVMASPARADEPDPFLAVSEARPLRERWQDCAASAVKRHLDTNRPAEAIADQALAGCKARETALLKMLARRLGAAAARRVVADLRNYDRQVLTRIIERLRQ